MAITKASSSAVAPATKGDLVVGSATNDSGVLAVGSTDQVLTVDSSTATGLKWASATSANASFSLLNAGGTTVSGTSTTISGISGMNQLLILIRPAITTISAPGYFQFRLNEDSTANIYEQSGQAVVGGSSGATTDQGMANTIYIAYDPTSSSNLTAGIYINGCNSSGIKIIDINAGTDNATSSQHLNTKAIYKGTSTISSITIFNNDVAMSTGKIYVYGSAV
jgi:hypothetical protein